MFMEGKFRIFINAVLSFLENLFSELFLRSLETLALIMRSSCAHHAVIK